MPSDMQWTWTPPQLTTMNLCMLTLELQHITEAGGGVLILRTLTNCYVKDNRLWSSSLFNETKVTETL